MKKISLYLVFSLFLLVSLRADANDSENTVSGSVHFTSTLLSKYMEKHGYVLIGETHEVNIFGAGNAVVTIKNKYDAVLTVVMTDEKGHFAASLPGNNNYRISVRLYDREIEDIVDYADAGNIDIDLGHFNSEKVDSWLFTPPLSYCFDCNIRLLESRDSL